MSHAFALALWLMFEAGSQLVKRWRAGELPPTLNLDAEVTLDHSDGSATVQCEVSDGPPAVPDDGIPVDGKLVLRHKLGDEELSSTYHGSVTIFPGEDNHRWDVWATAWRSRKP